MPLQELAVKVTRSAAVGAGSRVPVRQRVAPGDRASPAVAPLVPDARQLLGFFLLYAAKMQLRK